MILFQSQLIIQHLSLIKSSIFIKILTPLWLIAVFISRQDISPLFTIIFCFLTPSYPGGGKDANIWFVFNISIFLSRYHLKSSFIFIYIFDFSSIDSALNQLVSFIFHTLLFSFLFLFFYFLNFPNLDFHILLELIQPCCACFYDFQLSLV